MKKAYTATFEDSEKKLQRVMARLGVEKYSYDWSESRKDCSCYVEMRYGASTYRFENNTKKSADCGRNLVFASDLFAAVVYTLESLARAVEQGIVSMDMLLVGVPALPEAHQIEQCFLALGFTTMPDSVDEVKARFRQRAKDVHPDAGGNAKEFEALRADYDTCIAALRGAK